MKFWHSQVVGAIQDLYPNPPVLRYHRLAPKIEREFGQTTETEAQPPLQRINWLDIAVAFLLGYLIGGRTHPYPSRGGDNE